MVLSSRGVKMTSPSIWLPPGPLHSTWTTKVAPSRFLLRMVHRPNTESMWRGVIVTRETPASEPSVLQGQIFRIGANEREVVLPMHWRCERCQRDDAQHPPCNFEPLHPEISPIPLVECKECRANDQRSIPPEATSLAPENLANAAAPHGSATSRISSSRRHAIIFK